MKHLLYIIQNDPDVPPGNILENLTIPYLIHHPYRNGFLPELEQISALIVMGGAMGANDDVRFPFLGDLKSLIRAAVDAGIPYLGVCLGGQLLAAALGAKVVSRRWEELGTMNVSLTEAGKADLFFEDIPEEFGTFQWHHDSFDIPENGVLLAASEACPNQAFRVGACAWGTQFHPEVTVSIIRDWCAWDRSMSQETEMIVADFNAGAEKYYSTSKRLVKNFLAAAGLLL